MSHFYRVASTSVLNNMEPLIFKCDDCDKTYKSKSSLKRHINSVHFHRRFVCGNCNREYVRNIDSLHHGIKCHQPIIMSQNLENINLTNPSKQPRILDRIMTNNPSVNSPSTSTTYTLEATTALLKGEPSIEGTSTITHPSSAPHNKPTVPTKDSDNTDWYALLKKDLSVSDSEGGSPLFSTTAINTDIQKNPDIATETNTSPLCILNMGTTEETLITTHGAPDNIKSFFKIPKKTTTSQTERIRDSD